MKNWWLNLYTLPFLKKMILPFSVWCFANILNVIFLPKIRELSFLVGIYPLYIYFINANSSMGSNIGFHQNHVPFRTLRLSLFSDLFIQIFVCIIFFYISAFLPWTGNSTSFFLTEVMGTRTLSYIWICLGLLMLAITRLGIIKAGEEADIKNDSRRRSYSFLVLFFLVFIYGSTINYNFSSPFLVCFFLMVLGLDTILNWYASIFHSVQWYFKTRYFFVFFLAVIFFGSFQLLSIKAKLEVLDSRYSLKQKLQTFIFFKSFNFVLNDKTVRDLFSPVFSEYDLTDVLEGASSDVFQRDVDYLINQPDFKLYYVYLSTNKVTKENLKKIYDKYQKSNSQWGSSSFNNRFKNKLAILYPEGKLNSRVPATKSSSK